MTCLACMQILFQVGTTSTSALSCENCLSFVILIEYWYRKWHQKSENLLPNLVTFLDRFCSDWTDSGQNLATNLVRILHKSVKPYIVGNSVTEMIGNLVNNLVTISHPKSFKLKMNGDLKLLQMKDGCISRESKFSFKIFCISLLLVPNGSGPKAFFKNGCGPVYGVCIHMK